MNDMSLAPSAGVEERPYVWPEAGHIGKVPLDWLLPDPEQPRQNFDEAELRALAETLKAGGQRDIATVTSLTDEEKASGQYSTVVRGWIVGGERRWRAAKLVGIPTLEVRVKLYASKGEQALDAFMLNEQRVALSDIENAIALDRVINKNGWQNETQDFIAKKTGKTLWWTSEHMRLLGLCPEARVKMNPKLPQEEQLKRQSALFMTGFEHEVQRSLLTRMPFGRTTTKQQILWMKQQLEAMGIATPTRKQQPATLRRLTQYLANQITGRIKTLSGHEGFEGIFNNVTLQQMVDVIAVLKDAQNKLSDFVDNVIALSNSTKPKATTNPLLTLAPPARLAGAKSAAPSESLIVVAQPGSRVLLEDGPPLLPAKPAAPATVKPIPTPAPIARPNPHHPPVVPPKPRPEVRYVRPVAPKTEPLPQTVKHTPPPLRMRGDEKAISVMGDTGRFEMKVLNIEQFLYFKRQGKCEYQIKYRPQPDVLVKWEKSYENST